MWKENMLKYVQVTDPVVNLSLRRWTLLKRKSWKCTENKLIVGIVLKSHTQKEIIPL